MVDIRLTLRWWSDLVASLEPLTCTIFTFFAHWRPFFFRPRVFPRAPGCEARRGDTCTLGASLGPGRAPWRVLGAFEVGASFISFLFFCPSHLLSSPGAWCLRSAKRFVFMVTCNESSPFLSSSLLVDAQIRGHIIGAFPPSPLRYVVDVPFIFIA